MWFPYPADFFQILIYFAAFLVADPLSIVLRAAARLLVGCSKQQVAERALSKKSWIIELVLAVRGITNSSPPQLPPLASGAPGGWPRRQTERARA